MVSFSPFVFCAIQVYVCLLVLSGVDGENKHEFVGNLTGQLTSNNNDHFTQGRQNFGVHPQAEERSLDTSGALAMMGLGHETQGDNDPTLATILQANLNSYPPSSHSNPYLPLLSQASSRYGYPNSYYGGVVGDLTPSSDSHGWGWGKEKKKKKKKKKHHHKHVGWGWTEAYETGYNYVGILGLLYLFNLVATLLVLFRTTTKAAGRRRRSVQEEPFKQSNKEEEEEELMRRILPLLMPLGHAKNGKLPWECTLQGLCRANRWLVEEYGIHGRMVGRRVTDAASSLMLSHGLPEGGTVSQPTILTQAGQHGRNLQENSSRSCEEAFPTCQKERHHMPFVLRIGDVPHLLSASKAFPPV